MTGTSERTAPRPQLYTRDFTLFYSARTISILGDHMIMPVTITAAMTTAGYGMTGVGYALAAHMAPIALFVVFGGVLVDRFTPLRVMVIADIARLALHGTLAATFAMGTPDMWVILTLLALGGLGTAAFQPGYASVIPRIAHDVQRANAAIRVSESLMMIGGPAVAGMLLLLSDLWVVLALDASTFGISALMLVLIRTDMSRAASTSSFRQDLIDGWQEFRSRAWLWRVIVIWMLLTLTVSGPFVTLGGSVISLEYSESTFGFVMMIFGVGSAIGGLIAVRIKPLYPLRSGAFAMIGLFIGPLVVALELPLALIAPGYAVAGAAMAFWLVMFHTSVQTQIPPEALGRVHAYDVAGSLVMQPVGKAVAGPVAVVVVGGASTVLFFSATLALVCVAILLSVPAIRNLRRVESL